MSTPRRSTRRTAGQSPARLGQGDGFGMPAGSSSAATPASDETSTPQLLLEHPARTRDAGDDATPSTLDKLRAIRAAVGLPFLLVIGTVYFAQGFRSLSSLSMQMFLKDELGLEPAASQTLLSTAYLPWSCKPIYGLISDYFPIFGRRRQPYILGAGLIGLVSWTALSIVSTTTSGHGHGSDSLDSSDSSEPHTPPSQWVVLIAFAVCNLSTALSDVVVDAMVAEKAGGRDAIEDDLQSWCWNCMAVGGIAGSTLGAFALTYLEIPGVFLATGLCPLLVSVAAMFLHEDRYIAAAGDTKSSSAAEKLQRELKLVWGSLVDPQILSVIGYILFAGAVGPGIGQIFYFYVTDELGFSNEFLSMLSSLMWFMMLIGSVLGGYVFDFDQGGSYRRAFWWGQLVSACCTVFSLILVSRANTAVGIPDTYFVAFTDSLETILQRITMLPFLSIAAKLTPVGIEATMFACFMSISNFSHQLGSYWGAYVCTQAGLTAKNFDSLFAVLVFRFGCMLLPLFFTYRMIPDRIEKKKVTKEE